MGDEDFTSEELDRASAYLWDARVNDPPLEGHLLRAVAVLQRRLAAAEEIIRVLCNVEGLWTDEIRAFLAPEQPTARSCETCTHADGPVPCVSGCRHSPESYSAWEPKP